METSHKDGNNAELVLASEDLITLLASTEYIPRRPNVEIAGHIPRRDISHHSRSRCRSGLRRSATITNIHAVTEEMLMLVPPFIMDPLMDGPNSWTQLHCVHAAQSQHPNLSPTLAMSRGAAEGQWRQYSHRTDATGGCGCYSGRGCAATECCTLELTAPSLPHFKGRGGLQPSDMVPVGPSRDLHRHQRPAASF